MDTLANSQDFKDVEITVSEALVNDTRKGKIGLFILCVIFDILCFVS